MIPCEVPDRGVELGIAIIGYGGMGRTHSFGYAAAPVVAAMPIRLSCASSPAAMATGSLRPRPPTGSQSTRLTGAPSSVVTTSTSWTSAPLLVRMPRINEEAAAAAGKGVFCEKPLSTSYPEARSAWEAVTRAGVINAVGFNYRRLPAVALMHRMVADGAIGEARMWRGTWLSDEFVDTSTPSTGGSSAGRAAPRSPTSERTCWTWRSGWWVRSPTCPRTQARSSASGPRRTACAR